MLFADVVGFTPFAEWRDPEEVRELVSTYFERAKTVIGRYSGVVEKFIGDAVMAVWGTPQRHSVGAGSSLELTRARGGIRTRMSLRTIDFESTAYAVPPLGRDHAW